MDDFTVGCSRCRETLRAAQETGLSSTISELIRLIFYGRMIVILSVLSSDESERPIVEPLFFKRIVKW